MLLVTTHKILEKQLFFRKRAQALLATQREETHDSTNWGKKRPIRKSISDFVLMLSGGPGSWHSRLRKIVAHTTVYVEIIAPSFSIREELWIKIVLREVGNKI